MTWKSWAPLRIKFFAKLALQDRCWTAARLARHGLPHDPLCRLCDKEPETMPHLLIGCSFSRQTWCDLLTWCSLAVPPPSPAADFLEWWHSACYNSPAPSGKGLSSMILLIVWSIWTHRNGCIFDRSNLPRFSSPTPSRNRAWAKAGANGLTNVLP